LKPIPARIVLSVVLAFIFLLHASDTVRFTWLDRLDSAVYDWRLSAMAPAALEDRIVIVDIDEKSLAASGRWPWSRDKIASLLVQLVDHYHAEVVGLDIVFAEPDDSSGIKRLRRMAAATGAQRAAFEQALNTLAPQLDFDAQLAATIKQRPVVLGYYFNSTMPPRREGALPAPVLQRGFFGARRVEFPSFVGYVGNLSALQNSALGAGHFNMIPDADGVLRRLPMLVQLDGQYYESLSLAILRQLIGAQKLTPQTPPQRWIPSSYTGVEALELPTLRGTFVLPIDRQGGVTVPYRAVHKDAAAGSGGFTYLSAVDVLNKQVAAERLQGKIVLVGTSAPGVADLRNTPFSATLPGVEVHASLLAGMLDGTLKHAPAYMLGFEVVLLILTTLILGLALMFLSPLISLGVTVAVIVLHIALNLALYKQADLIAPLASPVLLAAIMMLSHSVYGYVIENRAKRQLTQLFGHYVPLQLVEQMARNPESYNMEGRLAHLSLLRAQMRGLGLTSSGFVETLPPKELAQLINSFLTAASEQIQTHRGTLDKYIDATALAFWGAPIEDADHARHAVEAALGIERAVKELAPQCRARGWPTIEVAVGINTGPVVVGDLGSNIRHTYTVMGQSVSLSTQLQELTSVYGVNIIAGEATKRLVPEIVWRELDKIYALSPQDPQASPGQAEAIAIYEPLGLKETVAQTVLDELACWTQFLKMYRAQQWDLAELQLINLSNTHPCQLYALYSSRLSHLRTHAPGNRWDGVSAVG
jgi:adenylate cyclase